jgi:hypothetical protein
VYPFELLTRFLLYIPPSVPKNSILCLYEDTFCVNSQDC